MEWLFLSENNFILIIKRYWKLILSGVQTTLLLSLVGTVVGFFLALIFANLQLNTVNRRDNIIIKILKQIGIYFSKIYVTVIRGTPMIVQAMIFYYSFYQLGIRWSPLQAGLFTISVNTTAYLTEVIKGAILAIDKGQVEAARSLGMSRIQTMRHIVLPQAIKNSMAPIGNEFIINIKDSAVLSIIQVQDLFSVMDSAAGTLFLQIEAMLIAAGIYLVLTFTTSLILKKIATKIGAPTEALPSSN